MTLKITFLCLVFKKWMKGRQSHIPTNLMLSPNRKTFQSVSIKQMGLEPFLTPFSILSAGNRKEGMTNTKQN